MTKLLRHSFLVKIMLIYFLAASFPSQAQAQQPKAFVKGLKKYRKAQQKKYKNPDVSPVRDKAKIFPGLVFFPGDTAYRVAATLVPSQDTLPFLIPTSNPERPKEFVRYGYLEFELHGDSLRLAVYRLRRNGKVFGTSLFLPFNDATNGSTTYGGGRYLDLPLPKPGELVTIDFNRAYHPYCAYSDGWSCPIPPAENRLEVAVEAGEKLLEGWK
ncbi:MAG: DUF1684 domain-containing protein [Bacteroidota bacterium]